jgi:Flp pilus assembly protein TadG
MTVGAPRQLSQALIETAITLPVMIALFLGFLAVGVAVQGVVDLNTAVYLAAASAVTAPANHPETGQQYASETYQYTVSRFGYLNAGGITCAGDYQPHPPPAQPGTVTCTASASVQLASTFAVVPDLPISATATATFPPYRSEGP